MSLEEQSPFDWKRMILFFGISVAILVLWNLVFPPPPPPTDAGRREEPAASVVGAPDEAAAGFTAPTREPASDEWPADVVRPTGEIIGEDEPRRVRVEVGNARVAFTNVGGRVASWLLLDHGEYGNPDEPIDLVQRFPPEHSGEDSVTAKVPEEGPRVLPPLRDESRFLPLQVITGDDELDRTLATAIHRVETEDGEDGQVVRLSWADGAGTGIVKELTFRDDLPLVVLEASLTIEGVPQPFHLGWGPGIGNHTEREEENTYFVRGRISWLAAGESETATTPEDAEDLPGASVRWAAIEDSFFAALFLPFVPEGTSAHALERGFRAAGTLPPRANGKPGKNGDWPEHLILAAPFSPQSTVQTLYVGPRSRVGLNALEAALPGEHGLPTLMDLGFVEPIAELMHRLLLWLHANAGGSWGISILLLTLCIRAAMFPFTHVSLKKMRVMQQKMGVVKPRLDKLRARYKKMPRSLENRDRERQEMMALYSEAGINPADQLMGCLPLLLSIPFFWALFRLLPQASEFRQEPFMWWSDLSGADPTHVWPILTAATMALSSRLNMSSTTNIEPIQRNMLYVFPVMFLWITWSAPLGLVVYWTASNVIQIGQQYLLKITLPDPAPKDDAGSKKTKPARKDDSEPTPPAEAKAAPKDSASASHADDARRGRRKKKRRKR